MGGCFWMVRGTMRCFIYTCLCRKLLRTRRLIRACLVTWRVRSWARFGRRRGFWCWGFSDRCRMGCRIRVQAGMRLSWRMSCFCGCAFDGVRDRGSFGWLRVRGWLTPIRCYTVMSWDRRCLLCMTWMGCWARMVCRRGMNGGVLSCT